ncbi:uncharacterized protein LOC117643951 [Thrips palmi]|uniref:Uncharacterized protein LOC117643951 n=1 Tax=Thrips palmi TaxID=161013 RepID=A0A6P8ZLK8_THRPL|nr:uncharacterized protein LOC117643951 [Thrips palmi]
MASRRAKLLAQMGKKSEIAANPFAMQTPVRENHTGEDWNLQHSASSTQSDESSLCLGDDAIKVVERRQTLKRRLFVGADLKPCSKNTERATSVSTSCRNSALKPFKEAASTKSKTDPQNSVSYLTVPKTLKEAAVKPPSQETNKESILGRLVLRLPVCSQL